MAVDERDPYTGRLLRGPQWSPNGHLISLAGTVEGEQRTAIWIVPSPGSSHLAWLHQLGC